MGLVLLSIMIRTRVGEGGGISPVMEDLSCCCGDDSDAGPAQLSFRDRSDTGVGRVACRNDAAIGRTWDVARLLVLSRVSAESDRTDPSADAAGPPSCGRAARSVSGRGDSAPQADPAPGVDRRPAADIPTGHACVRHAPQGRIGSVPPARLGLSDLSPQPQPCTSAAAAAAALHQHVSPSSTPCRCGETCRPWITGRFSIRRLARGRPEARCGAVRRAAKRSRAKTQNHDRDTEPRLPSSVMVLLLLCRT